MNKKSVIYIVTESVKINTAEEKTTTTKPKKEKKTKKTNIKASFSLEFIGAGSMVPGVLKPPWTF